MKLKQNTAINTDVKPDPMYQWACDLFPICRSITGEGVRETLDYLKELLPGLKRHEINSGQAIFDWTVPEEWNITQAFIENENGKRLIDFADNNLHVVGYSEPVDEVMNLEELRPHLYTLPEMPEAIPYITSYYKRRWGFCLSEDQLKEFKPGKYHVKIDSSLKRGVLNYADLIIPGKTKDEVLISTYICHPSMANNELSGPAVATALARWLQAMPKRRLTYRFVFVPETIGAIAYLAKNIKEMKKNTVAGYVITCAGDERTYSFLPSRNGDTLADRVALNILQNEVPAFKHYSYLERGSDERQYCSPGVDLPIASIMRSKYAEYPEYHTSLDNLGLISQKGLEGSLNIYKSCIQLLEKNIRWKSTKLCEPQLGKYELYPSLVTSNDDYDFSFNLLNFLAYADGENDLLQISELINLPALQCAEIASLLAEKGLVKEVLQ